VARRVQASRVLSGSVALGSVEETTYTVGVVAASMLLGGMHRGWFGLGVLRWVRVCCGMETTIVLGTESDQRGHGGMNYDSASYGRAWCGQSGQVFENHTRAGTGPDQRWRCGMYRGLTVLVTVSQVGLCHGWVRLEPPRGRRGSGFDAGWWDAVMCCKSLPGKARQGRARLGSARQGQPPW
jgi:hypothetical protein